jgi:hypothetical protein
MAYATQQTGFRTSVQSSRTAPFRAGPAPPRRRVAVVTQAAQDPVGDVAKKAIAAVAAATLALSPLAANAGPLDSVLGQAGAAKDKAAGAAKGAGGNPVSSFIDEAKAGADKGVKSAPSIGEAVQNAAGNINPDSERVAGSARQGAKDLQNQPNVGFSGNAKGLQVNVGGLPNLGGAADKAKGAAEQAKGAAQGGSNPLQGAGSDTKSFLDQAKNTAGKITGGSKDIAEKPVAFSGARGLQVNVGLPSPGGVADKAKGLADKAAGAAKDATGSGAGPLQGAAGDAKKAVGDLKQGGKDISTKPVSFSGASGLQVNVSGMPNIADKAKGVDDEAKGGRKEAELQGPAKNTIGKLAEGTKDVGKKSVGFSGDARSLQVNVDAAYGGGGDKPASATDKSTGAAQDLSDQTQGPKTDASGDAKTVDAAKRAIKKLKDQPMVGFNGRTDGLQVDVGFGGLQDKAADAAKKAGNKVQGEAKGAGGGDGPSLGDAANKAKQAVGNITSGGGDISTSGGLHWQRPADRRGLPRQAAGQGQGQQRDAAARQREQVRRHAALGRRRPGRRHQQGC